MNGRQHLTDPNFSSWGVKEHAAKAGGDQTPVHVTLRTRSSCGCPSTHRGWTDRMHSQMQRHGVGVHCLITSGQWCLTAQGHTEQGGS